MYNVIKKKKKKKLSSKKSRKIEEPSHAYDHEKFVNEGVAEKFNLIFKNRSFIKEFFFNTRKIFLANKGWRALCQPPRPVATMVVREFYVKLIANVLKKVRV